MPSTTTLFSSFRTRNTRATAGSWVLPASSPVVTSTISPLRTCMSHHLGRQVGNLDEPLFAQFAGDGPEDAGAARVLLVVDQYQGVAVEADVAAVGPPCGFLNADDHAF